MSDETSRNDQAFLQYMRALLTRIETEDAEYQAQLNEWFANVIISTKQSVGPQSARKIIITPAAPTPPRQIGTKDLALMFAWARGENVLLHVLERD